MTIAWIALRFFLNQTKSLLLVAGIGLIISSPSWCAVADGGPSIAFFYGIAPPVRLLRAFDRVVVESDNLKETERAELQGATELFAYVSIGEVAPSRSWHATIKKAWVLGENPAWGTQIMDLTHPGWQTFLLEQRLLALWNSGYRAFFLDTLDSYRAAVTTPSDIEAQQVALASLVERIAQRFPGVSLLFNRGFEILPAVAHLCAGVVAESLFRTWDPKERVYGVVAEPDRQWLQHQLEQIASRYRLPITVIDYVAPHQRELARRTARQIAALGFVPWVSTPELDQLGVGRIEIIPRRVLLLFDSEESELPYSEAHRFLATPLEYLGYSVDYLDVRAGWPAYSLAGRYAGIATWFTDNSMPRPAAFRDWLQRQIQQGVKVAIFNSLGFEANPDLLRQLGLEPEKGPLEDPIESVIANDLVGFEAGVVPRAFGLPKWRVIDARAEPRLRLRDRRGRISDPVLIAPWGGMALAPYVIQEGFADQTRWLVDPVRFLRQALDLEQLPAPDITTENGLRLLTAHIDGDGFYNISERRGNPFSAEVIRDEILKRYSLPHTVSIVEGEVGPSGLRPDLSAQLEPIARSIFQLKHVELASHTYSHPFDWLKAEHESQSQRMVKSAAPEGSRKPSPFSAERLGAADNNEPRSPAKYHLPIPGYQYDVSREVVGSVRYINERLAPPNKKVKVFLWSGNALATETALDACRALGIANLNGGDTVITEQNPSLTAVSPSGIPIGEYFQAYAPVQNENLYTHNWTGPFYGYRRVIESFRLTDAPRRLKPMAIYYHFYSGGKHASLKALETVYQWALQQQPFPLWLSEYVDKVQDFREIMIARGLDDGWRIYSRGAARTLRLDPKLGWPDLKRSEGIIGVRELPQGRYVSLDGRPQVTLYLTEQAPKIPYLERSNGSVLYWRTTPEGTAFRLKGHLPVTLQIAGSEAPCRVSDGRGHLLKGRLEDSGWRFGFADKDTGDVSLRCC